MIRRSFRVGLWLGLLGGIVFAVVKLVQARQPVSAPLADRVPFPPSPGPSPSWPRLDEPAAAVPREAAAPVQQGAAPTKAAPGRGASAKAPAPAAKAPAPAAKAPAPAAKAPGERAPAAKAPAAPSKNQAGPRKAAAAKRAERASSPAARAPARPTVTGLGRSRSGGSVKKAAPSWVDPDGNICPKTHPVKAKLSSRIFQLPGMFAYDRTHPDRCYRDADAATGDGFRAAKR